MKKIFTLLTVLAFSALAAMATTFTFQSESDLTQTANGITVTVAKGSGNNAPAFYDNGLRLYASNTITVTGSDIKSIELTFAKQGSKDYASLTATPGTLVSGGVSTSDSNLVTDTWTGNASSVTFTLGTGQRLLSKIIVNNDGTEGDPETPGTPTDPDTPDNPGDLDPDFEYPEPTVIGVPSKTVQGEAYSFVVNNVEVASSKGAITDNYFSAHAGFNLTFTAAKPIKGIVINGFVKKGFEANVTSGDVRYLSPDEDTEANPVLVITDIDAKNVTISCVKQLRCYNVEVYFNENPEATIGSGSAGSGETVSLVYDSAEAVFEAEYSSYLEDEVNYSIFLFNAAEPEVPYFALDIYPAEEGQIPGTYTWDDWTLGEWTYYVFGYGDDDMAWAEDGRVTISKNGDIYTITGTVKCDNSTTYEISFTGEMPIYLDEDYYGGGDDGVEDVISDEKALDADAPMYDVLGRRVGKNYRGIYIQNGRKVIGR